MGRHPRRRAFQRPGAEPGSADIAKRSFRFRGGEQTLLAIS